jgi:hypothetical protein
MESDGNGQRSGISPSITPGDSRRSPSRQGNKAPTPTSSPALQPNIARNFERDVADEEQYDEADNDSAYGSGSFLDSDTESLNSEVTKYRVEHGRQYHGYKDGAYWASAIHPFLLAY